MKQFRISKKRNRFILTVLFVFVSFFIWGSIQIIGKYYATKNNKGVAVASGLYFNSDKLMQKIGLATGIDDITKEEIESLAIFTNSSSWSNGPVELPLKIQNYDSNILFNESGLNISYQIEFKLLDAPVGATYSIIDKNTNEEHLLDQQNAKYISSGTLAGGSLIADTYRIKINLTGKVDEYKSARVLVLAYPVAPDYLVNTENQKYRLLGIFEGHPNEMKLEIDSAGFLVEKEFGDNNVNWKQAVENSVAYIYNFKTKGDVVQNSSTSAKREVQIKWRSEYLSFDKYSEYFDQTKINTIQDENSITWNIMNIDVLPYANINITFYKNEAFISALDNGGISSADDFHNLVQVTVSE